MKLIGKLICAIRARFGARKVHKWGRPYVDESAMPPYPGRVKSCTRCGHTVPVKPRKRKGAVE